MTNARFKIFTSKETLFDIANKLRQLIHKRKIKCHLAIPMQVGFYDLKVFSWLQLANL